MSSSVRGHFITAMSGSCHVTGEILALVCTFYSTSSVVRNTRDSLQESPWQACREGVWNCHHGACGVRCRCRRAHSRGRLLVRRVASLILPRNLQFNRPLAASSRTISVFEKREAAPGRAGERVQRSTELVAVHRFCAENDILERLPWPPPHAPGPSDVWPGERTYFLVRLRSRCAPALIGPPGH